MNKSEFLTHLNRGGVLCSTFPWRFRAKRAKENAIRNHIFVEDPKHESDEDNPVLFAMICLGESRLTGEDLVRIEKAWEYFQEKTRGRSKSSLFPSPYDLSALR